MKRNIAVYNCDGELVHWIDAKRLQNLISLGRVARVTCNRKGEPRRARLLRMPGEPRRARLLRMPGEPKPTLLSDYRGAKYCFRQHLDDGHRCYKLRALGERDRHGNDEYDLEPDGLRPIFIRVLLDCMVGHQAA
jgi:hypothetical protein